MFAARLFLVVVLIWNLTPAKADEDLAEEVGIPHSHNHQCILLIGGRRLRGGQGSPVEYYHPNEGTECNMDIIGNMYPATIESDRQGTSGCYLSSTHQVVMREMGPLQPSSLYGLKNEIPDELQIPYANISATIFRRVKASTAASIGPSTCLSCGGFSRELDASAINKCYQFDSDLDASKWTPIASMPHRSEYAASVSLTTNDFYVMGGSNGSELDLVFRFNVAEGKWYKVPPMHMSRQGLAAAPLSRTEFIACGGFLRSLVGPSGHSSNTVFGLSICEIYDTVRRKWRRASNLNKTRYHFAMINFRGDVYALGGDGGGKTVEKYDRATGKWQMAKAMKHPRTLFVAVAV